MERVRLVDWLKSERDQHVGGGLYYNSQILFAYNSNHMGLRTFSWRPNGKIFVCSVLRNESVRWSCISPRR